MKKLLTLLAALALTLTLAACKPDEVPAENEAPVLVGLQDVTLTIGDSFNELEGVTASDKEDGDLTSSITVSGTVNLDAPGSYVLNYSVKDKEDLEATASITVTISDLDIVYPNGFYNYKFADTELRHTFMAAAEKYLMNTQIGGIPLFASGSFNLYSSRLQLPVDEYVAVMGFGTAFSTMSADDSTVLMDDGEAGEVGEYTYRTTVGANPGTFNQWLYDTSTDSDLMGVYYDALYAYEFNADKTGYAVVPSMAGGDPEAVNPTTTETGKEVAKVWNIPIRADLEWKFHPDTDAAFLATNPDTAITAQDFVDTFKLALDEQWFRAISGGGDFVHAPNEIKGAQAYLDGGKWEDVGIKVVDGKLQLEFVSDQSNWNVRYFLSSFVMTPINTELYDFLGTGLGEDEVNSYGTTEKTVAYHGAYYVHTYEADKIVRMKENDKYHSPEDYFFTGYNFSVITDSTIIFSEFIAGKLEGTGLPTAEVENYENDPRLRRVPGATTYRLMINGLGNVEDQRAEFPDGSWIPEPILSYTDMKLAMFHALDRQTLAEDILKVRTTNMYYFSNAYLVDAELGTPYRQTEQGMTVGEGLSPDTYGFNFDAARALFLSAVEDAIADGVVVAGTEAAPTVLTIELNNYSDSESWDLACAYIKTAYEETFVDEVNHVQVAVEIYTKDFPAIYYDYMMIGEFDTSVGGISGSTLDAASFLDTYASDNRGGFTINWGFDTSVAEIEVIYNDFEGNRHREMWSFDALTSALNGEVYLENGEETSVPAAKDIEVTPTTVSFSIAEFSNASYKDITYSVEYYDINDDAYYPVTGKVDVVPATKDVVVTGLLPFYYGYDATGGVNYQGDYQIVVNYVYTADDSKDGKTISPWFEMGELLSADSNVYDADDKVIGSNVKLNSAMFDVELNVEDLATRTVSTMVLFTEEITTAEVLCDAADVTAGTLDAAGVACVLDAVKVAEVKEYVAQSNVVTFTDLTAVSVDGLMPSTHYVIEVTTSDAVKSWISFSTEDLVVLGEVTVTDTTAEFSVTPDDEATGLVIDAYKVYEWQVVTPAVVDDPATTEDETAAAVMGWVMITPTVNSADLTKVNVSGLTAEKDYKVVVEYTYLTVSDKVEVEFTTEATPAS